MKMFNINKFCNNDCKPQYSRTKTAGNDPSITRKMRYSQITRNLKYKTVRTYNQAVAESVTIPTEFYPKGQIFSFPK